VDHAEGTKPYGAVLVLPFHNELIEFTLKTTQCKSVHEEIEKQNGWTWMEGVEVT
jgi:hypothetical protein